MKQKISLVWLMSFAVVMLLLSCAKDKHQPGVVEKLPNTVVLEWNEIAFQAFGGPAYQHSLMASRINAMTHIAMHDALNAIQPHYETYAFNGKDTGADPVTAAAAAAHAVLVHELPARKGYLDSALQTSLAQVPNSAAKTRGLQLGEKAAAAIINARSNDGSNAELVTEVPASATPGVYQGVPPFGFLFAAKWEDVKLFSLQSKSQFRPGALPALTSAKYKADYDEIKAKGQSTSTTRTADQTSVANFWYEFSEAGWNRVARQAVVSKKLNLLEAARLLSLVDIALADSYIAGWDAKFHYNIWRPYTAIRFAANDGDDSTPGDATWEPALPTPPVQDYPSTHSALGNAGATVLARILGDNTPFTMTSFTALPAGSTRSFTSFSQAAKENADSRVWAGIHFRFSCDAGLDLGSKIGNWVVDTKLKEIEK